MRATVRRQQTPFAILLFALLLLTALERRLAEIDFNSTGVVRVENGEKVDGDEIFNRLVYVDDLAAPQAPAAGEVCHADVFFFQAEDGIRDLTVTGVQTCALPISVMLPPGRERLAANPSPMGSVAKTMTIGVVFVAL